MNLYAGDMNIVGFSVLLLSALALVMTAAVAVFTDRQPRKGKRTMTIVEITALALVLVGLIVLGVLAVEAYLEEKASRPAASQPSRCPFCGR